MGGEAAATSLALVHGSDSVKRRRSSYGERPRRTPMSRPRLRGELLVDRARPGRTGRLPPGRRRLESRPFPGHCRGGIRQGHGLAIRGGAGLRRGESEGQVSIGPRAGAIAQPRVRIAARSVSPCVLGVEPDDLGEIVDGAGVVARMVADQAATVAGGDVIGHEPDRLGAVGQRLIVLSQVVVNPAAGTIGDRVVGLEADRLAVVGQGLVMGTQVVMDSAAGPVDHRTVGHEADRLAVVGQGLAGVPPEVRGDGPVAIRPGVFRVEPDRLGEFGGGAVVRPSRQMVAAALIGDCRAMPGRRAGPETRHARPRAWRRPRPR